MSADQKMKKILLLTAATAASTGIAQDTEPAPEYNTAVQLPELVVTATRTPTPTAKTAATIATISKSDFEANGFTTVADALESVPGLSVVRNGTPGQATSVFTRVPRATTPC